MYEIWAFQHLKKCRVIIQSQVTTFLAPKDSVDLGPLYIYVFFEILSFF